jgi:hypothetical protein
VQYIFLERDLGRSDETQMTRFWRRNRNKEFVVVSLDHYFTYFHYCYCYCVVSSTCIGATYCVSFFGGVSPVLHTVYFCIDYYSYYYISHHILRVISPLRRNRRNLTRRDVYNFKSCCSVCVPLILPPKLSP